MLLLDPNARPVIGHRGAAAYAPENTLESFRQALALGAEALEFDIRASADGEPMVFHDAMLDRTTDASGPLGALTCDQLQQLDAGFRFTPEGRTETPFRGQGVRIPLLRQVLAEFPDVPVMIEIKECGVQRAVAEALHQAGAAGRAVVAGDDWRALLAFRDPPFLLGASRRDITRLFFRLGAPDDRCRAFAVPDRWHGLAVPSRGFVARARRRGATVHVWTVDDARPAIALWRRGVQGIVTNRPDVIRAARDSLPRLG